MRLSGVACADPLRTAAGLLVVCRTGPVPGPTPYPRGGGKSGRAFPGWVGYVVEPVETTASKQGGTGKTGGHDF